MSQEHPATTVRSGDWLARIVPKLLVVVLALAVMPAGVWTYYNVKWGGELSRELEAWQAKGLPLSLSEVIPQPVPDSENAAPIYLSVFHVSFDPDDQPSPQRNLAGLSDEEEDLIHYYRRGKDRAANIARVRAILSRPEVVRALQTLKRASQRKKSVFPVKWEEGFAALSAHLARFRHGARLVAANALILAETGHVDEALDWCLIGLRMADHAAMDPRLMGQLVATAVRNMTLDALEEIISDRPVPARVGQALQQHLQGIDLYKSYTRAITFEAVLGHSVFLEFRTEPDNLRNLMFPDLDDGQLLGRLYFSWVGRPLHKSDEARYLRIMRGQIQAAESPWAQIKGTNDAVNGQLREAPPALLSAVLVPVVAALASKRDREAARLDLCRIALALKAYKQQHGRYPASLGALAQSRNTQLPKDPFTGRDYVYRQAGHGFVAYSVGSDGDDDGGVEPESGKTDPDGDIVWRAKI